jgi:GDP-mannose 6-dehydrogenase
LLRSNDEHIDRAFQMITRHGRQKIALFGLSFKAGTDDLRESPLVALAERLLGKGYELAIFDRAIDLSRLMGANREYIDREIPHLEKLLASEAAGALDGAGTIVIGHVGPSEIQAITTAGKGRNVIDLQGVQEIQAFDGIHYEGICW